MFPWRNVLNPRLMETSTATARFNQIKLSIALSAVTLLDSEIETVHGLPHPLWERIDRRICTLDHSVQAKQWQSAIESWLERVAAAIGGDATVHACEDVRLLASCKHDRGKLLAQWSAAAISRIVDGVGEHRTPDMIGPRVILVFGDHERYYDYIDRYYGDGEHPSSGGVCLHIGYVHVVIGHGDLEARQQILAHELTHLALAPLDVPVWVNEGIAQVMEGVLTEAAWFTMSRELLREHQRHWQEHGLDGFWSGESFGQTGDSQRLSYHLAEILIRNILAKQKSQVIEFIQQACWQDAGNKAALGCLGRPLSDLATEFLGPGEWSPPDRIPEYENHLL